MIYDSPTQGENVRYEWVQRIVLRNGKHVRIGLHPNGGLELWYEEGNDCVHPYPAVDPDAVVASFRPEWK